MRDHKLTQGFINRIIQGDLAVPDTTIADQDLPRHCLRVCPSNRPGDPPAATFGVRVVLPNGRRAKIKVGDARSMTLLQARAAARLLLAKVDAGGDPVAERSAHQRSSRHGTKEREEVQLRARHRNAEVMHEIKGVVTSEAR